ncbi:MAG: PRC-barrel domain-containing protein [Xanthobacteraceae bacterium]|nr:PRC-barrel domain-containing protein [Xanthobacteraceae bacterium]
MLKSFVTATAFGALLVSGAIAQQSTPTPPTSTTPPAATSPQTPPAATSPQAQTAPSGSMAAGSQTVISEQKPDQYLASKFKGTDVVGTDNQKIGDVNDLLFDKSGQIQAVIIGVGGFLGLGAKDVALSMQSFEVMPGANGADTKLKLSMTKEQLQQAAEFKPYQPPAPRPSPTTGAAPGTARPGGTTK